jgi:hypothetical protein
VREGPDEHKAPDPLGVCGGIRHCDHPAVREAEQVDPLLAQMLPQLLEVGAVVLEVVRLGVGRARGAAGPARLEDQELQRAMEAAEIGELRAGQPGPAWVAYQRRAGPDAVVGKRAPVRRRQLLDRASHRAGILVASRVELPVLADAPERELATVVEADLRAGVLDHKVARPVQRKDDVAWPSPTTW